jgi:GR25 family glycosyltransferase involved in LPS biosynthesis
MRFIDRHGDKFEYEFIISKKYAIEIDAFDSHLNSYLSGTLGCMSTHLMAWKKLEKSPSEFAMIFEDDIARVEYNNLEEIYGKISSLNSTEPIICQVGHVPSRVNIKRTLLALFSFAKTPLLFRKNSLTNGLTWGTHAYLINKTASRILIQLLDANRESDKRDYSPGVVFPLDLFLISYADRYMGSGITFLRSVRNIAKQEFIDSSINSQLYTRTLHENNSYNELYKIFEDLIELYANGYGKRAEI